MSSIIYTRDEVACHDGKSGNGVWIIIKNGVYDVTEYLNEHPGGGDLVLEYAGKDATTAFNDFGHSSDALKILKLHEIGRVTEVKRTKDKSKGKKIKNPDAMEMDAVKRKNRSFLFPLFRSCAP